MLQPANRSAASNDCRHTQHAVRQPETLSWRTGILTTKTQREARPQATSAWNRMPPETQHTKQQATSQSVSAAMREHGHRMSTPSNQATTKKHLCDNINKPSRLFVFVAPYGHSNHHDPTGSATPNHVCMEPHAPRNTTHQATGNITQRECGNAGACLWPPHVDTK